MLQYDVTLTVGCVGGNVAERVRARYDAADELDAVNRALRGVADAERSCSHIQGDFVSGLTPGRRFPRTRA